MSLSEESQELARKLMEHYAAVFTASEPHQRERVIKDAGKVIEDRFLGMVVDLHTHG